MKNVMVIIILCSLAQLNAADSKKIDDSKKKREISASTKEQSASVQETNEQHSAENAALFNTILSKFNSLDQNDKYIITTFVDLKIKINSGIGGLGSEFALIYDCSQLLKILKEIVDLIQKCDEKLLQAIQSKLN